MVNRTTKQRCQQSLNFTFGESIQRHGNFVFWHVSTETNPRQLSRDNRIALFTIASRPISITYLAVSLPADKTRLNSWHRACRFRDTTIRTISPMRKPTAEEVPFRRRCYFVDGRRRCFDEISTGVEKCAYRSSWKRDKANCSGESVVLREEIFGDVRSCFDTIVKPWSLE